MGEAAGDGIIIEVHVTFGSEEEARRVARAAVEQRLAACANLTAPVHSIYRWEGAVQAEDEVAVVFKTAEHRWDELIAFITRNHSYDVPGIIVHRPTNVNQSYRAWVNEATR